MNVTLPNGVVLEDVPEGTPKHVIAHKAIQAGLAKNSDFGYEDAPSAASPSALGRAREGLGAGLVDVSRKATNLLLPEGMTPEWASDKAINRQKDIDRDLEETTAGFLGKLGGQVVGTLPVGGAGGALAKAATAVRGASTGGKALAATLGSPITRGAVEGATAGAIIADPNEGGEGATLGGALGAGFGALGQGVGKALSKFRLTDITDEAKALQKMTGHFIPLSQSAKPGIVKQVYNALLANIPGVGGTVRGQYKAALDDFRRFIGEEAHPPKANIVINPDDSVQTMFDKLSSFWKGAFDPIRAAPIRVFKNQAPKAPDFLEKAVEKATHGRISILQPGEVTTGARILDLKDLIAKKILPKESDVVKRELVQYMNELDGVLKSNLKPTPKSKGHFADLWDDYEDLAPYHRTWEDLQTAAAKVTSLDFTPKQLAKAAQRGKTGLASTGKTRAQVAGELGKEALEDFPSRQGLFQTLAASAPTIGPAMAAGTFLGGPLGGALGAASVIGVGKGLAKPGVQRLISGQTNLMKEYAKSLRRMGYTGRQISTILGVENASGQ